MKRAPRKAVYFPPIIGRIQILSKISKETQLNATEFIY